MDSRRFLIPAASGLMLCGCAGFYGPAEPVVALTFDPAPGASVLIPLDNDTVMETALQFPAPQPINEPPMPGERPYEAVMTTSEPVAQRTAPVSGRVAIAAANTAARTPSRSDDFVGGVQVFDWSPGRVFEVWTAPLRVTTLTLSPGETILSKAAGDTVRWQIGEATSGSGSSARTHVMLKPLERGLETNLILTTSRRVYLIDLRSGGVEAFNAAVAWDIEAPSEGRQPAGPVVGGNSRVSDPVVTPQGSLDGRYRIEPQGRGVRWTPTAVFNDGTRTFITFNPDLQVDEAPVLFVIAANGETQMVNYRQDGGLFVVDRVFDRAELRLGDRRPQVVRIRRLGGQS